MHIPRTKLQQSGYVGRYILDSSAEILKTPKIAPDSPIIRVGDVYVHQLDRDGDVQETWWVFHRKQKEELGEWKIAVDHLQHPTDCRLILAKRMPPSWVSWKSTKS